ncbi:carbohydrate-binding protein [Pedobacter sp. JY14-1]|uniref:carbohydrate-binding protein n=1 Tax=Pedobacter sp. JY14-1 TaxID=3034151 RepID=UPI0023E23B69|nr:carbohydrate-binding protein [Pedobacter sp. JY14-1]
MKKIFTYSGFCALALLTSVLVSCEKEKLSDVIVNEEGSKVALELPAKIEVSNGGNFSLDNSELTLPLTINFNGASSKAFTVKTVINTDTVATLIANKELPEGTVALEQGKFSIPPEVNIAFGVKSVGLNLVLSRSYLELNYGKDIAFAIQLDDPSKGNSIAAGKRSTIVVIKTGAVIEASKVHYVRFSNTTPSLNFPLSPTNLGYEKGSLNISMPVELTLTGEAGAGFIVDLVRDQNVINTAIAAGEVPADVIKLDDANWSTSVSRVQFEAGKNTVKFNVDLRLMASIGFLKPIAMGIRLSNPTKWQLAKSNTTLVVIFDPAHLGRKPFNGTPFIIKGGMYEVSNLIPASNYDFGGEGVAYHDNGGRDGGQFRRPDQVDIGDNNIVVGWTAAGEWLSYTVDVQEEGDYEFNAMLGSDNANGTYSLFTGNTALTGLLKSRNTGGYGNQQIHGSIVHLKKGPQVLRFYMDNGAYDLQGMIFTRLDKWWDGIYTMNGTITRNSATGPDTNLGGTLTNRTMIMSSFGKDQVSFMPIWRDGSLVGAIDNTYLTVDRNTNQVTVKSLGNATLKNTPGKENKWDPATQTFTLNFTWGDAPNTREVSVTMKYGGPRQ